MVDVSLASDEEQIEEENQSEEEGDEIESKIDATQE